MNISHGKSGKLEYIHSLNHITNSHNIKYEFTNMGQVK